MNTVTRLVLIPEDQYLRLKNQKANETERIINSNLSDSAKIALSNEIDQQKVEPMQIKNTTFKFDEKAAVSIPNNLLEHTEAFNVPASKEEEYATPMKTPKKEKIKDLKLVLRSIDDLIDENGAILNAAGRPVLNSNIDDIIDFFSKKAARKKPIGTKRVIEVIKENNLPITNLILNKNIKDILSRAQTIPKRTTWEMLSRSF